ncbi:hypothetical protein PQI07_22020 [Methylobacterium sp. 092160098-2]|uniref:hypothetical protein n=1 Tax=Methylobacterium sp. 092160098-2 TaxID=3025129 RepID=UPI002381CD9B|nr:hypothetical protein [Methylobacterium sp. 092160098-2]MDE4913360.1 hypothetical protein [Methylobacterium sp. 092160098-2]
MTASAGLDGGLQGSRDGPEAAFGAVFGAIFGASAALRHRSMRPRVRDPHPAGPPYCERRLNETA